jgi:hypothetical protein
MKKPIVVRTCELNTINENKKIYPLVMSILNYLDTYPKARDTARGISEWWISSSIQPTLKALNFLLGRGYLNKSHHHNQMFYSRNLDFTQAELEHLKTEIKGLIVN